jgi:hypothetical protein
MFSPCSPHQEYYKTAGLVNPVYSRQLIDIYKGRVYSLKKGGVKGKRRKIGTE